MQKPQAKSDEKQASNRDTIQYILKGVGMPREFYSTAEFCDTANLGQN